MRIPWIDSLRGALIVLVVAQHACVTYSGIGSWYYESKVEPGSVAKTVFLLWEGHMQSFFMGLLFFLAGVFSVGSLRRKGRGAFIRDRMLRLALPALFFMLLVHPATLMLAHYWPMDGGILATLYARFLVSGDVLRATGPLWFAVALLGLNVLWAMVVTEVEPAPRVPPNGRSILVFGVILVVFTFMIRTVQPIGTSVMNMQLCFFPQYILAFLAGTWAGRGGWLPQLAESALARRAGWIALVGGPVVLLSLLAVVPFTGDDSVLFGGWHWEAFALAAWEQLAGLGLGLGALAWAARVLRQPAALTRWWNDHAFSVYVLHTPVLVGLAYATRSWDQQIPSLVMAVGLTLVGLVVTAVLGAGLRKVPGLRTVLS